MNEAKAQEMASAIAEVACTYGHRSPVGTRCSVRNACCTKRLNAYRVYKINALQSRLTVAESERDEWKRRVEVMGENRDCTVDALWKADSENARLRARVEELEAAEDDWQLDRVDLKHAEAALARARELPERMRAWAREYKGDSWADGNREACLRCAFAVEAALASAAPNQHNRK